MVVSVNGMMLTEVQSDYGSCDHDIINRPDQLTENVFLVVVSNFHSSLSAVNSQGLNQNDHHNINKISSYLFFQFPCVESVNPYLSPFSPDGSMFVVPRLSSGFSLQMVLFVLPHLSPCLSLSRWFYVCVTSSLLWSVSPDDSMFV